MSLTATDLNEIRTIVRDEVHTVVREELESAISTRIDPRLDKIEGRIEALENDVKDMYKMLSELQKLTRPIAHFEKYDLEKKILTTYENIIAIAKKAGVTLPRE